MKNFIIEHLLNKEGKILSTKTSKAWFIKRGYEKEYEEIIIKTSFLENPTFPQRLYHIINDIDSVLICPQCKSNPTTFRTIIQGYDKYCSRKCSSNTESTKNQRKTTIIEKYGEYPNLSDAANEKRKKTNLEKYGYEYPLQSKEIQYKKIQTFLRLYGVDNPSLLQEVKDKKIRTCLNNWGTENPNQCEEIIDKRKKTNLERYGVEHFYQSEQFKEHMKDYMFPSHSIGEIEIFEYLKSILDCEVEQGNKSILKSKELDIYIKDKNVAIEYCGLYWHSNKFRHNSYHKEKFDLCKKQNIKLITIFEDEWLKNKDLIKTKLAHILNINKTKKIYARKCIINSTTNKEKAEFYNKYHIQNNGNSSIHLGLYYDNELVSCMSFKKRRHGIFELDRYATKYIVVGGFNKLLNHFKSNFDWTEIITFADLRWHSGELYTLSGFILDKTLNPDYSYFINNKRIHKFNFRKSLLKKKFTDLYDENLSESENTKNLGIMKIYDCGKSRFKLINGT